MMRDPLVSVVVPVYNVEDYLDACIRSIVEQSYTHLEIILLDDGSTDGSGKICDSWAQRDSRIQVIHKANEGLSETRNLGIKTASGEYLLMPDSDDLLAHEMIEVMVQYALNYQAQCVLGGYKKLLPNGTVIEHSGTDEVIVCIGREMVNMNIQRRLIGAEYKKIPHLSQSSCMKLYSRPFIEAIGLQFTSTREIGCEDFYFNIQLFRKVDRAVIIPDNFYYYRDNRRSITTSFNPERANCLIRLYQILRDEPILRNHTEYLQMLSANILGGISVHIKQIVAQNQMNGISMIGELMNRKEIQEMLSQCRLLEIKFPLSLFCFLMKYKMKYSLFSLIGVFLKIAQ